MPNDFRERPRLPVPPLRSTLDRYLSSIKPFLLDDEARGGQPFAEAYAERIKWAEEYEHGVGRVCQERLLVLDQSSPRHWLDNFWADAAYLRNRASILINSNIWMALENDRRIPEDVLRCGPDDITLWQIRRAAWLVHRIMLFKATFLEDTTGAVTPRLAEWVSESIRPMFNTCRIPMDNCDRIAHMEASAPPSSICKLVVMIYDWFYSIEVTVNSAARLEQRLKAIVLDAKSRIVKGELATPVGILTTDSRDPWANNLRYLLSLSPRNQHIHTTIVDSVFILALDHYTHSANGEISSELNLNSAEEIISQLHNARSGRDNARNRWFDKALTIIVESNTRASANGEHSPFDGLGPSILADYACKENIDIDAFNASESSTSLFNADREGVEEWERLDWIVDDYIKAECFKVEQHTSELIKDSDHSYLLFSDYGRQWIKEVARLSPDAFIQMALQLVYYRLTGEFTATYESASTAQMFKRGRTETVRSYTSQCRAFIIAIDDPAVSMKTRLVFLHQADNIHTKLCRQAAAGKGIDRHLLALQLLQHPSEIEANKLFLDPLFQRSQEWKLSTSAMIDRVHFRGCGFGATCNDGYGISYRVFSDSMVFCTESKVLVDKKSTDDFHVNLRRALKDMKEVCLTQLAESAKERD